MSGSTIKIPILDDDGRPTGKFVEAPLVVPSDSPEPGEYTTSVNLGDISLDWVEQHPEDKPDEESDEVFAARLRPVESPVARLEVQPEKISWPGQRRDPLDEPEPQAVSFPLMSEEEMAEARERLDRSMFHILGRIGYQTLRPIDLTQIEGKTYDEVAALPTVAEALNSPENVKRRVEELVNQRWVADRLLPEPEVDMVNEMAREFRRGAALGAGLTLAAGLAWAVWDRVVNPWR